MLYKILNYSITTFKGVFMITETNAKKETVKLRTLSQIFDIPLNSLRIYASRGDIPGVIKKGRSVYVVLDDFREWWLNKESRRS